MRTLTIATAVAAALATACARAASPDTAATLSVAGRSSASVTLAAEGNRVAAAWLASADAGADVFAAVSDDGGRHFSRPVRVNDRVGDAGGNGEQPPRVVMKGRSLSVVWVSKREGISAICAANSADGGRTFSPTRTISPDAASGARGWESAALSDDGTVHVAWLDGRHAVPMSADEPHVHGAMRQDIVHAMWRPGEPVIESPVADNVCFCCKTGVAVQGRNVFVVWRHLFRGGVRDVAIARSTDASCTFGAPVRVSADNWKIDACPDDGPSLAIDADGTIHVAWPTLLQDAGAAHIAIFETVSRDGGATFAPRTRVDASETGASHPRIAVANGTDAVVWDEAAGEGRRVMLRRSGTADPSIVRELGSGRHPALTASADGFVVAWTEQTSGPSSIRVIHLAR